MTRSFPRFPRRLGELATNKKVYPTFMRAIAGHEATFVPAFMSLFEHFDWKRIGIVSEKAAVTRGIHDALSVAAKVKGVAIAVEARKFIASSSSTCILRLLPRPAFHVCSSTHFLPFFLPSVLMFVYFHFPFLSPSSSLAGSVHTFCCRIYNRFTRVIGIDDGPAAAAELVRNKLRVVVLLTFAPVGRHMICAALRERQTPPSTSVGVLFGRQQAWILMGHNPVRWWERDATDKHDCSNDELRNATQGYLAIDRDEAAGTQLIDPTGVDPKVWLETYETRSGSAGVTLEGVAAYDAIWTWAYALHDLLYTQGVDATTLTASEAGSTQLFDTLAKQDFYGASGRVHFDPISGDRRGLPVKIENSVGGEEIAVGNFSPESGIKWDSTKPLVWHGSTFLDTGGDKNNGTNYAGTGDAFAPSDGRDVLITPLVYSIVPSVITSKGGKVTINGGDFRPGIIAVTISDKICLAPVFMSDTIIICEVPPGVGGPHTVVVKCNGVSSEPRKLLSYFLPRIYDISKGWVADGSKLLVTGAFFNPRRTKCRLAGHPESIATVIDDSHLECVVQLPDAAVGVGYPKRANIEISNDDGQRWVSGTNLNAPVKWGGGALLPVTPRTIDYPKEVVIGGIIPTDRFPGTRGQQYIKDITMALNLAARSINAAVLYPGNIQLRVEVLLADPGGSGTPNTVTEVATAFAQKGLAKNATAVIGIAGPMWSSNAVPLARAVSNPFQLPMVSYDAWTSVLDDAAEFPYYTRVGPANSDISKVCGVYLRSMRWMDVAVVTDDDAFTSDYGRGVANDMKEHGGTVLYHGIFSTLPLTQATDKLGRLHMQSVKNISSHLLRAREKGARILFVAAKGDAGKSALYDALDDVGFLGKGYAVFDGATSGKTTFVNGIVHMSSGGAHECKAATCPHKACGATCAAPPREMNQAYDAVLTLATALVPFFRDGGVRYLAGAPKSRSAAMAAIRATSLSADIAASGLLELSPGSTKRNKWNFG